MLLHCIFIKNAMCSNFINRYLSKFVYTTKSSIYGNNVVYAEEKKDLLNPMISFTVRLDIKKF